MLLLLDLSESLNETLPGSGQTILETAREAVALLGWAIDQLGDAFAIAGFHSNTRHDVRYQHIKGFSEALGRHSRRPAWRQLRPAGQRAWARPCATPGTSARGAQDREADPADADRRRTGRHRRKPTRRHLIADAKKAVEELSTAGITTFCLSLDPKADDYVGDIFGSRWQVLDRIERLPEQLPLLYLSLTR